jgi:hypothetical protein
MSSFAKQLSHFASSKVLAQAKFGTMERLKRDKSAAKLKNEQSRSRTRQNIYEKDVCHTSRGVALAVCGGQRERSGAAPRGTAPLDGETRKDSRSGDKGYLIERGADNGKNAPSRNESRSPRVE